MRLIDVDKLWLKTGEVDAAPTVEAIPIEWIKSYIEEVYSRKENEANIEYKSTWIAENRLPVVDMREIERIGKMIEEWERENAKID